MIHKDSNFFINPFIGFWLYMLNCGMPASKPLHGSSRKLSDLLPLTLATLQTKYSECLSVNICQKSLMNILHLRGLTASCLCISFPYFTCLCFTTLHWRGWRSRGPGLAHPATLGMPSASSDVTGDALMHDARKTGRRLCQQMNRHRAAIANRSPFPLGRPVAPLGFTISESACIFTRPRVLDKLIAHFNMHVADLRVARTLWASTTEFIRQQELHTSPSTLSCRWRTSVPNNP